MFRWLAGLLLLLAIVFGLTYYAAGRGTPPILTIDKPDRVVGQAGALEVTVEAPNARLTELRIALEQNGRTTPLYELNKPEPLVIVTPVDRNHLKISRPLGRQSVPELRSGAAKIVVNATRPSMLNLRTLSSSASKDIQVRLEAPRIAVVSSKHYVNHGGSEFVVYRVTPPEVASGVRVGDVEYPGFALGSDPSLKGAFFALLHDQPLNARIVAFARDEAGNEARATFVDSVFEKPFKNSRIELDDRFIDRVVPEIIEHSPELKMTPPPDGSDMLPAFLRINGELRKINAAEIAAFARKTAPERSWHEPFVQLGNSKVEASFADHRTYFYKGKEVDKQTHLGFDLAVTEHVPVVAANDGVVLNASWLGIYGNCVIIDHGMGVQSLYGHLMSFDVNVGDKVTRGQQIGRSDSTGLAGGDHLHFTMLVGGQMVNPVEWWDAHWIADRVDRKLADAGVK
ncbi:MAG TPA: M23 family metallopeptidase [Vicinamibacterales bacterium]|jgi:murein DD-endopeptidase MepM/ murein hydrolase activator NlpD